MSIGTIVYYLLWPAVAFAIAIFWVFKFTAGAMDFSVEYIRGLHDEIKNF